jgi:arylsulfatase A-like enzyme
VTVARFAADGRLSVIVLTVESTRLDAIGPQTTPALWRIAQQGTRFTAHRSASAWTGANIVSILTGLSAFRHGIHGRDASIPAAWNTPLEHLAQRGWRVAGLQPFMLSEGFRNLGLAVTPGAGLFPWLAERARGGEPFFLWYHYLDTHLPYEAARGLPEPRGPAAIARAELVRTKPVIPRDLARFEAGDEDWLKPLYYQQFGAFDRWFADFWRFLDASGLRERAIVVLTTDHGEELLERGLVGHASTTRAGHLYDEIARIPLIVWLPPSLRSPARAATIDAPSSHIDIMPTLFALLGLAPPALEGRDLFGPPNGRAWRAVTSRAGFAEPDPAKIERFAAAWVEGDWKLHLDFTRPATVTRTALYNLATDPGERQDLAQSEPERAARMTRALMPDILAMRIARPRDASPGDAAAAATAPPRWLFPAASGTLAHAALPSPLRLRWRGAAGAAYRLQYRAGTGPLALRGEIATDGPSHDFGPISRDYWARYIVPYETFRIRVGYAGRDDLWSPWLTIEVRE